MNEKKHLHNEKSWEKKYARPRQYSKLQPLGYFRKSKPNALPLRHVADWLKVDYGATKGWAFIYAQKPTNTNTSASIHTLTAAAGAGAGATTATTVHHPCECLYLIPYTHQHTVCTQHSPVERVQRHGTQHTINKYTSLHVQCVFKRVFLKNIKKCYKKQMFYITCLQNQRKFWFVKILWISFSFTQCWNLKKKKLFRALIVNHSLYFRNKITFFTIFYKLLLNVIKNSTYKFHVRLFTAHPSVCVYKYEV